jgi:AcrR family transcriptional regulator
MTPASAPALPSDREHERTGGRPLDPAISARILDATLDVLDEEGYERLSMEAVAHRAGVHRPAVYRRWPNKLELVVAALSSTKREPVDPDTGDTRSDLVAIVSDAVTSMRQNPRTRVGLRMLVGASTDDELAAVVNTRIVEPRRAIARRVVARGIERGVLRPDTDPDLTIDVLVGTALSRVMIRRRPMTRADIDRLVDVVLEGIAAA